MILSEHIKLFNIFYFSKTNYYMFLGCDVEQWVEQFVCVGVLVCWV